MRGKPQHNDGLIAPVDAFFTPLGARVRWEFRTGPGKAARAADLCADLPGGGRVVVEAERFATHEGIAGDVEKAQALVADLLFLITPTATVRRAIETKLACLPVVPRGKAHPHEYDLVDENLPFGSLWIVVHAKGPGLAWLRRTFGSPESLPPDALYWQAFTSRSRVNRRKRRTKKKVKGRGETEGAGSETGYGQGMGREVHIDRSEEGSVCGNG